MRGPKIEDVVQDVKVRSDVSDLLDQAMGAEGISRIKRQRVLQRLNDGLDGPLPAGPKAEKMEPKLPFEQNPLRSP